MEQISVQVRGRFISRHWSCRVLSVSPQHGVLSLSQSRHPEKWSHRPLRITCVQLWPCFAKRHLRDPFNSPASRLTVRVYGDVVRLGSCDVQRDGRVLQELGFTAEGCHGKKQAWMLRFTSYRSLEKAITLISQFAPNGGGANLIGGGAAVLPARGNESSAGRQRSSAQPAAAEAGCESLRVVPLTPMTSENPFVTETTAADVAWTSPLIEGDVAALLAQIHAKCEEDAQLKLALNTTESSFTK